MVMMMVMVMVMAMAMVKVMVSGRDIFALPVDFLQCSADHLDWEEFEEFVTNIEGRVEYHIPGED